MTDKERLKEIYDIHDIKCNQKYGNDLPYSFHLKAVVAQMRKYSKGFNDETKWNLLVGAAGHDLIEDARVTYNDILDTYGADIANIIYACTDEKGRNRSERHNVKFFEELAKNRLAVLVKLCDVIANVLYSSLFNSSMLPKYRREFINLYDCLYIADEYEEAWFDLKRILNLD